jgi:hypothetical protein
VPHPFAFFLAKGWETWLPKGRIHAVRDPIPNPVPNPLPKLCPENKRAQPSGHALLESSNFLQPVPRRQLSAQSTASKPLKYLNKTDPTAKRGNYMQTLQTFF